MRRTRRTGIFLAGAAALALVAAGCSSGSNTPTATNNPPPRTTNDINPLPRDQVKDGGELHWPVDGEINNFNYYQIDGTELNNKHIFDGLLPEIFHFDAAGKPIVNTNYLTGEPKVVTDPKQVVTYELNPKAVWYSGKPVNADDFIALWKANNGSNKAYQISSSTGYEDIESVTQGKDQFEVIVTFKNKFADWKSLFAPLYPASAMSDPNTFNTGWKDAPKDTAGPFMFQSYDKTAKVYTVVRNPKWWGNPPKLDKIIYPVIDDDASPQALANGEIDVFNVGPSVAYHDKTKVIPGVEIRRASGPNFRHLTINGSRPYLSDVKVRQALAMAINRQAIADAELGPLGQTPKVLNNHIFMLNQDGYQDNATAVVPFNPDKAKTMLDEAGWTVAGATRAKGGQQLKINFVIPSGVTASQQEAEIIQNNLKAINVEVDIKTVPSDDFFDNYVTPGNYDFTVFSWIGTQFPVSSSKSIYAKPQGTNIQQNYARVGSDDIDALYQQANAELDPQKVIELGNEIDKKIWEEVHSLTFFARPDDWACKTDLANFGAVGFADLTYEDIGWAKTPSS